jgi:hypothetical protein
MQRKACWKVFFCQVLEGSLQGKGKAAAADFDKRRRF